MLKFSNIEKIMLGGTGFLALVLGVIAYISVFSEPEFTASYITDNGSLRSPASKMATNKARKKSQTKDRSMFTLDLKCLEHKQSHNFVSEAKMLQLKARLCNSSLVETTEVINRTNGTKASVFPLKGNRFMTDYISLAPGKNQLLVRLTTDQGEKVLNNLVVESVPKVTK